MKRKSKIIRKQCRKFNREKQVVIAGCRGSGKTTARDKIANIVRENTFGIDKENSNALKLNIMELDINAHKNMRHSVNQRLQTQDAIVFVVDTSDRSVTSSFINSHLVQFFDYWMKAKNCRTRIPLLILLNPHKEQNANQMTESEVRDMLALNRTPQFNTRFVSMEVGSDAGVVEALRWLHSQFDGGQGGCRRKQQAAGALCSRPQTWWHRLRRLVMKH